MIRPTSPMIQCGVLSLIIILGFSTSIAGHDVIADATNVNSDSYGLRIECPEDIYVSCDDDFHGELPLPHVYTDCDYCQGGYISGFIYMGSWNGHKYYCSKDKMTWQQAKSYCEAKGGYLAVVGSEAENDYLANLIQAPSAYIGLSDHQQEDHWKWVNGEAIQYTNWYYNQPNNYNNKQHYVELLKNGYWNDQYHYEKLEFIMELPCYTVTKTRDEYRHYGSHKKRHIEYKVKDACGRVERCSFSIHYEDEVKLWCPSNIDAMTSSGAVVVTWNSPVFETCCKKDCSHDDYKPGYIYMGSHKGSKYYCSKSKYTWPEAKSLCYSHGGHLAVVNDAAENQFLASKLQANYAYIGVSDHQKEGTWMTVNNDPCPYYNWYPGEPDNTWGKQHYVEMNKHGYWNDQYKDKKREYIMEVPECQSVKQIEGPPSGSYFPVGHHKISYKAEDGCGNVEYCSFYVNVKPVNTDPEYCEIWAKRTDKGYIDRIRIKNKWYNSGSNGGYYNHKDYCTSIYQGQYLDIKLKPGYKNGYHKAYWKIYLDSNGDGDFKDAYEYVAKGSGYGILSARIPISHYVKPGKTRMRVIMQIGKYSTFTCGTYEYGETEDFCIYIREKKSLLSGKQAIEENIDPVNLTGEDNIVDGEFLMYPNPASREVFVRMATTDWSGNIDIYNTAGQRMSHIITDEIDVLRIDLSGYNPGLYLVRLQDREGEEVFKKLIVE